MTFVALLRAINVSGQNRVPMGELRTVLEGLGLRDVRTYLQSGNVVFEAGGGSTACDLAAVIEAGIERDMGPRVGVLVLPAEALAAVAAANPFRGGAATGGARGGDSGVDEKWLHATFLFGAAGEAKSGPSSDAASSAAYEAAFGKLELPADVGEAAAFVGVPPLESPIVYLKLPNGYGRTKLNNGWFERKLGAAATTRNWRTVRALVEMSAGRD